MTGTDHTGTDHTGSPLWTPNAERVSETTIDAFRRAAATRAGRALPDTTSLHAWSVEDPDSFWDLVWDRCGIIGDRTGPAVVHAEVGEGVAGPENAGGGPGPDMTAAAFFPGARCNFAENLLAPWSTPEGARREAIRFVGEDGTTRALTGAELTGEVAAWQSWLRSNGVTPGDRVAAWLPHCIETVTLMLATTSIGAVFSSSSPDFGAAGVLDRFGQITPTVLVAADGYHYGGRTHDCLDRLGEIVAGLPGLKAVAVVPFVSPTPDLGGVPGAVTSTEALEPHRHPDTPLAFERFGFDHPGFILYSSGTTGAPKCIVHRAAGVLLKHATEHRLHCDVRPGDTVFYFTTCGWMMWNWLVSALAVGARIICFDGSPVHPDPEVLWRLAETERVTLFGASAKFLDATAEAGVRPGTSFDLSTVRTLCSTGSPLSPERFAWVYREVAPDVHLASISGGTDLCGCFVAGDPTRPVFAGEIQGPALGMAVDVWDPAGTSCPAGVSGELVCTSPFPSMPLGFWGDDAPLGERGLDAIGSRYRAAYYERFDGVWAHGDFASWTPHGGMVIHGRSDATLNAGGVRIGTAEIYRQVEQLPGVAEALAIGQSWEGDTRIVLFVRLTEPTGPRIAPVPDELASTIRRVLRQRCSPRHVPAVILAAPDLPRTRSNKLVELAVGDVVHGRPVRNREALANPEALDLFADLPELG